MRVNVLDFMTSPLGQGMGAEGPVQPNHREERSVWVRLSGTSLSSKPLVSRQIAGVRSLNAPSDGGFATRRITAGSLKRRHKAAGAPLLPSDARTRPRCRDADNGTESQQAE